MNEIVLELVQTMNCLHFFPFCDKSKISDNAKYVFLRGKFSGMISTEIIVPAKTIKNS